MKQKQKMKTNQWKLCDAQTIDSESHVVAHNICHLSLSFHWLEHWKESHIFGTLCGNVYDARNDVFFSMLLGFCVSSHSHRPSRIVFSESKHFSTSALCFQCYCCMLPIDTFAHISVWLSQCILNIFRFCSPIFHSCGTSYALNFDVMGKSFIGWNFSSTETSNRLGSFVKFWFQPRSFTNIS